jgi:RimJ/RimL family protein N-acetyltransferase
MRSLEELETPRLSLRPPKLEDAELIFESYAQDTHVTRYLTWRPHQNIEETKGYLARCKSVRDSAIAYPLVITRKDNGQLIGMVEVRINDYKADIGYVLSKREWGRGYMPEVVEGIIKWAMDQEEIFRVWAVCDVENTASARVMEKAGMKKEGVLRRWIKHPNISEEPRDCYCYAIVK